MDKEAFFQGFMEKLAFGASAKGSLQSGVSGSVAGTPPAVPSQGFWGGIKDWVRTIGSNVWEATGIPKSQRTIEDTRQNVERGLAGAQETKAKLDAALSPEGLQAFRDKLVTQGKEEFGNLVKDNWKSLLGVGGVLLGVPLLLSSLFRGGQSAPQYIFPQGAPGFQQGQQGFRFNPQDYSRYT